jgi:hypothetical protein
VRGVSYYIRVHGTLEIGTRYPGIWVDPKHGATHITTYPEPPEDTWVLPLTRVNSTNVLDEGLRIGEIGRRMNSKVRLVEIGVYRK